MSDSFTDDHDDVERDDGGGGEGVFWDWDEDIEHIAMSSPPRPVSRPWSTTIPGVTLKGAPIKKEDFNNNVDGQKYEPWLEFDLDEYQPVPGFQITIGLRTLSRLPKKKRERLLDGEVGHMEPSECSGTRTRRWTLKPRKRLTN